MITQPDLDCQTDWTLCCEKSIMCNPTLSNTVTQCTLNWSMLAIKRSSCGVLPEPDVYCGFQSGVCTGESQSGLHTLSSPSSAQAHTAHPAVSSRLPEEVSFLLPDPESHCTHTHTRSQGEGTPMAKENETCSDTLLHLPTLPSPSTGRCARTRGPHWTPSVNPLSAGSHLHLDLTHLVLVWWCN